ncbi:hypothetical protein BDD12DRAFT_674863, partial [Trichophaea hybrida]
TLADILSNIAPPPYSRSSFLGYVYQEKCMELLLFPMEVDRYWKHRNSVLKRDWYNPIRKRSIRNMWEVIVGSYIDPHGSRTVGLPRNVRGPILSHQNQITPPSPEIFDPAVDFIYDVIQKKLLIPYI